MMKPSQNPLCVLTGANDGLGFSLLQKLLIKGYQVVAVVRTGEQFEKLSNLNNDRIVSVATDLRKRSAAKDIKNQIAEIAPNIEMLINCAGASSVGRFTDLPENEFADLMQINFQTPVDLIREFLPDMLEKKHGCIVNVLSGTAWRGLPLESPYSAAKAALMNFTSVLRDEVDAQGIHVLSFSPGPLDTRFCEKRNHYDGATQRLDKPKGKSPEEVANRIWTAIENKEERVSLGTRARIARALDFASPSLLDKYLSLQM